MKLAESKIKQHVEENGPAQPARGGDEYGAILEGTLLSARDSFEEKKVPLFANLVATAPFTNTPASNLIDTLQLAERLTYRQLGILSVIPGYDPDPRPPLTNKAVPEIFASIQADEGAQGVLHDLLFLIAQRLVAATKENVLMYEMPVSGIVPRSLRLTYPSRIAVNGMRLIATIPASDVVGIMKVLGPEA